MTPYGLQIPMPHSIGADAVTFCRRDGDRRNALAQLEAAVAAIVARAVAEEREACAVVAEAAGRDYEELAGKGTEWGRFIARKIRGQETAP